MEHFSDLNKVVYKRTIIIIPFGIAELPFFAIITAAFTVGG